MTNEERQKLCEALRSSPDDPIEIIAWMRMAANEIERLADRVNALEHIINLDMYEVTKTALVQAQDEIERLAALVQSDAEPSIDEDAVDEAFETWVETQSQSNQRGVFHAGVEFGLRHAQSDAEPFRSVLIQSDIDAAVKAGLATRNPAPHAAAGGPTPSKTVTIGETAPPRPDASEGLIEAAEEARDLLNGRHNVSSDAYKAFCILNAAISRTRAADRSKVSCHD